MWRTFSIICHGCTIGSGGQEQMGHTVCFWVEDVWMSYSVNDLLFSPCSSGKKLDLMGLASEAKLSFWDEAAWLLSLRESRKGRRAWNLPGDTRTAWRDQVRKKKRFHLICRKKGTGSGEWRKRGARKPNSLSMQERPLDCKSKGMCWQLGCHPLPEGGLSFSLGVVFAIWPNQVSVWGPAT